MSRARRPWLVRVPFLLQSVLIDYRTGGMGQDKDSCVDDVTVHCSVTTSEPYKGPFFFVAPYYDVRHIVDPLRSDI